MESLMWLAVAGVVMVVGKKEINIGFRLNQGQTNCPLV